jgi:phage terminase Nu1 subunit (DNA packaging protein)
MTAWLTYREAAKLVGRKRRAIQYWRARGMPMEWQTRDGQRVRVVEKKVLQAWFRQRLKNDPVHQQRLRAAQAAENVSHDATRHVFDDA